MSTVRVWLIIAAPLVAQFAFAGVAAGVLRSLGLISGDSATLTSLPQALVLLGAYVVLLVAILLAARALGEPREVLALRRVPFARGAAMAGAGLVAGIVIALALEPIFHGQASQRIDAGALDSPAAVIALVISLFTIVVAAATCEELYFRGLLYGRLDARLGAASAIVGSAGLFGLVHFEPNAFPTLFGLGLVLGVVRWRSGSVAPGIAIHAANNILAAVGILMASS